MPAPVSPGLYWVQIGATLAMFGWMAWRYAKTLRSKPSFKKADVVFQEWNASGRSQKNIITKLGGARNCVRLVVTKDFLWVTSYFPFSLFTPLYDLEHVIPLSTIVSVQQTKYLWRHSFLLTYRDSAGSTHTLKLLTRKPDDFVRSLGVK
jgi:hypothetical protein